MTAEPKADWTRRPGPDEFAPPYLSYVARVPDGDVRAAMEREGERLRETLRSVGVDRELHAYAPGKWTIRGLVGHMIDAERVLTLRALWFARAAATELPGFEENDWARVSNAGRRPLAALAEEFAAVRRATVLLLRGLDAAALERRGAANGVEFTVRALAWIVAGHAAHHRNVLEERYLK